MGALNQISFWAHGQLQIKVDISTIRNPNDAAELPKVVCNSPSASRVRAPYCGAATRRASSIMEIESSAQDKKQSILLVSSSDSQAIAIAKAKTIKMPKDPA